MRIAGLLALAILLPVTAYAALININTANATLLDTLPGIGPSKAATIIDYRTKNGLFAATKDIQSVKGIGPATFANIEKLITVEVTSAPTPVQLSSPAKSLNTVQAEKPTPPIINPTTNIQQHEEAVIAPTAEVEPAAVGAVSPMQVSRSVGIFHSPWTLGLIGVIVLAGGAFIFL